MIDASDPVALTERLMAFDTVSPARGEIFDELAGLLTGLGFHCTRLPFGDMIGDDGVDNLYAEYCVDDSFHLSFCGHVDVVPPGDESQWRTPPFTPTREGGMLYGRGSVDMKSAVASYIAAFTRLLSDAPPRAGTFSLIITGDEESHAVNGTAKIVDWLKQHNKAIDFCITGEPTSTDTVGDTAKIGRRGSMNAHLTVIGTQGHVAYPDQSANAAHGMVKVLAKLCDTVWDDGSDMFPPSHLQITSIDIGNAVTNISPGRAEARFNIRFNDRHDSASLEAKIRETVASVIPNSDSAPEIKNDTLALGRHLQILSAQESFFCPPGPWHDRLARAVKTITGRDLQWSTAGGISDSRFVAKHCPVTDFGLRNESMHQIDEHTAIADIETLCAVYLEFLKSLQ